MSKQSKAQSQHKRAKRKERESEAQNRNPNLLGSSASKWLDVMAVKDRIKSWSKKKTAKK